MNRIPYETCPLCDVKNYEELCEVDCTKHVLYRPELPAKQRWLRCYECRHVFTDGYFDDEAFKLLLSKTQKEHLPEHLTTVQSGLLDLERKRFVWAPLIESLGWRSFNARWLDVGFGDGSLLLTAAEYGYEVVGIDVREASVHQMARWGINVQRTSIEAFKDDRPFQVVSMLDVLEHTVFPGRVLERVRDLMQIGGELVLSMPNMDSPVWAALGHHNPYWQEIEHFHNFGRERLYKLLRSYGFTPTQYKVSTRYRACMEVVSSRVA